MADAEAIGRLTSLALRSGISAEEVVSHIPNETFVTKNSQGLPSSVNYGNFTILLINEMKKNTELIICGDFCPTADTHEYFEKNDSNALFNDVLPVFN